MKGFKMKITESRLRKIIRSVIKENFGEDDNEYGSYDIDYTNPDEMSNLLSALDVSHHDQDTVDQVAAAACGLLGCRNVHNLDSVLGELSPERFAKLVKDIKAMGLKLKHSSYDDDL